MRFKADDVLSLFKDLLFIHDFEI